VFSKTAANKTADVLAFPHIVHTQYIGAAHIDPSAALENSPIEAW